MDEQQTNQSNFERSIFERSESIDQLAGALAAAQAEMTFAKKDSTNPFLKTKYSDLASVWDAVRAPLSKNGLCVSQMPTGDMLVTVLAHKSGQYIASTMPVKTGRNDARNDAQAYGSALTYARRYALSAIVGIAQDDDDGEEAGKNNSYPQPNKAKPSAPVAPKSAQHTAQTNEPLPPEKKLQQHTKKERTPEEIKTAFYAYIQKKQSEFGASDVETVLEKFRDDNGEFEPEKFATIAEALEKKFPSVKGAAK